MTTEQDEDDGTLRGDVEVDMEQVGDLEGSQEKEGDIGNCELSDARKGDKDRGESNLEQQNGVKYPGKEEAEVSHKKELESECEENIDDDNPSTMTSSKESVDKIESGNEPICLDSESDIRSHAEEETPLEDEKAKEQMSQMYQTVLSQINQNSLAVDEAMRNLQAENLSFRNENVLLKERVKTLERKMELITQDLISTKRNTFSNDQYLRQHNLEIEGIATIDEDKNLEETVTDILKAIDVEVSPDNFEACHRLMTSRGGKHDFPGTTICRFTNQRICENIHRNKVKLEELKETGFYANISINENVNLYFKDLISKCEILKRREKIEDTWSFKGIPIIKLYNGDVKHITHPYDLERLFTGFNYSLDEDK